MSVTNLAGTTWYLNETLDLSVFPEQESHGLRTNDNNAEFARVGNTIVSSIGFTADGVGECHACPEQVERHKVDIQEFVIELFFGACITGTENPERKNQCG